MRKGVKHSRMPVPCNSKMPMFLVFFVVLYAPYTAFALENTFSCPVGHFEGESVVSDVARMCGPTENAACPAQLSRAHIPFVASNGNDGNLQSMAHTYGNSGPHTFRIDFEKTRTVQYIKFSTGNRLRIESSGLKSESARVLYGKTMQSAPTLISMQISSKPAPAT